MATMAIPFTRREAFHLRGRHVRLLRQMGTFPAGLTGAVVDQHDFLGGYVIEVAWEHLHPSFTTKFEYFTKDDFEEYLIEC